MNPTVLVAAGAGAGCIAGVATALLPMSTRSFTQPVVPAHHRSDDVVAAFEQASRDVRAGHSPRVALTEALHHHPGVLPTVRARLDADETVADAIRDVHSSPDETLFVHALRVSMQTDAHPADVIDRAALIARERAAWRHERLSQAAQARLSARLLTMLPLVFAAWSTATSARVRDAVLHQPSVSACLVLGCVLNAVGWWWMRHLVRGGST